MHGRRKDFRATGNKVSRLSDGFIRREFGQLSGLCSARVRGTSMFGDPGREVEVEVEVVSVLHSYWIFGRDFSYKVIAIIV